MHTVSEEKTTPSAPLWIAVVVMIGIFSYLLGFVASEKTGVEPGFFEQPEAGGYGVVADTKAAPGLDDELQDHYSGLLE